MPNKNRCKTCHLWDEHEHAPYGYCRAKSPIIEIEEGTSNGIGIWPITDPDDWCGEYEDALKKCREIIEVDNN